MSKRLRILQTGAAWGMIICAGVVWLRSGIGKGGYRLLSDTDGLIQEAVCIVNSARRSSLANAALVSQIVNRLPATTKMLLAVNDPSAFRVAFDPFPGRVEFLVLPAEVEMTIWPQDPFVVRRHPTRGRDWFFRRYLNGRMTFGQLSWWGSICGFLSAGAD